jgi:hypothetical protein
MNFFIAIQSQPKVQSDVVQSMPSSVHYHKITLYPRKEIRNILLLQGTLNSIALH